MANEDVVIPPVVEEAPEAPLGPTPEELKAQEEAAKAAAEAEQRRLKLEAKKWDPSKAKYYGKDNKDLGFVGKLGYLAEAQTDKDFKKALESGADLETLAKIQPSYIKTFMKALGRDIDDPYAADIRGSVGKALRGLSEATQAGVKTWTGKDYATSGETRLAREAQTKAREQQQADISSERAWQEQQNKLSRDLQTAIASGNQASQEKAAMFSFYSAMIISNINNGKAALAGISKIDPSAPGAAQQLEALTQAGEAAGVAADQIQAIAGGVKPTPTPAPVIKEGTVKTLGPKTATYTGGKWMIGPDEYVESDGRFVKK